jgi:CRP/FNR family transcriptional regulator
VNEPLSPHEEIVRDAPLLARLRPDDFQALVATGRIVKFRKGQTIFRQDDPGDSFFVIVSGSVHITRLTPDGRELTVAILGPGECFGDLALLDGRPRSAGAAAAEKTATFVVMREAFLRWLDERPAASFTLLETLSLRLRHKDEVMSDLAFVDLAGRLAKRLADLALATSPVKHVKPDTLLRVTQAQLAAALGASRQSVNRELQHFEDRGWIAVSRGAIRIVDYESLRMRWQGG